MMSGGMRWLCISEIDWPEARPTSTREGLPNLATSAAVADWLHVLQPVVPPPVPPVWPPVVPPVVPPLVPPCVPVPLPLVLLPCVLSAPPPQPNSANAIAAAAIHR